MSDPKHPNVGDVIIDASDVQLVDITPDRIRELTKVRDGYEKAVKNVIELKPEAVARAGLNPADIERLKELSADEAHIGQLHAASEKLTELLYETRQDRRHEIGTLLGEFAAQARRRAERAPNTHEVLGPVEPLMDYQYGPAKQAVATREAGKDGGTEP